jgi:hypothetical protein
LALSRARLRGSEPRSPFIPSEKCAIPNYLRLYTPRDSAVVFIDHQPQMLFGVRSTMCSSFANKSGSAASAPRPLSHLSFHFALVTKAPTMSEISSAKKAPHCFDPFLPICGENVRAELTPCDRKRDPWPGYGCHEGGAR